MVHFKNLRLKPRKGLQDIQNLLDLGRMNVLSGPNNSGKTTVLECISLKESHFSGIQIDADLIQRFKERSLEKQALVPTLDEKYLVVVKTTAAARPVWYRDEFADFCEILHSAWFEAVHANTGAPAGRKDLQRAYDGLFPDPTVVLVPAKRAIETRRVAEHDLIQTGGKGILNWLMHSKNQAEPSDELNRSQRLSEAFTEISDGWQFGIFMAPTGDTQTNPPRPVAELKFRRRMGQWIAAEDCGLGFQDLLVILYFSLSSQYDVVNIEEPENHLHPDIQRRLIQFLIDHSDKQFFFSTHSSVFLNTQGADRVFACRMTDSVRIENATNRAALLTELGYSISDNLTSDLLVLCEGPKDKPVLEEFFRKKGLTDRQSIKVWPLGGDIMDQLDLSVFQEYRRVVAIVDGDPGSSEVRKRFLKRCSDAQIPVTHLKRYSLENYFSLQAIVTATYQQPPTGMTELKPTIPVAKQLGFEVKKNGGKIAKLMRIEDIAGTDLDEFLEQLKQLLTN